MPMNLADYPPDWPDIRARILERAGNRCEWVDPASGVRCAAVNGQPSPITGSRVVLTVAHLDHDRGHNGDDNLAAWCAYHHLAYDRDEHNRHAAETRLRRLIAQGQLPLWGVE